MLTKILDFLPSFTNEMAAVGRLFAAYSEIEYALFRFIADEIGDKTAAFELVFRQKGEKRRLALAKKRCARRCAVRG